MMKIFEVMKNPKNESVNECLDLLGIDNLTYEEGLVVLDEVAKYVFDVNDRHSAGPKTFDLNLDYKYYFSDFLRLGINLNKDNISWWEFDAILEGLFLDENSVLSRMLSYRLYEKPPKSPKVQEEKEHRFRMKMKEKYALPIKNDSSNKSFEKLWNYLEKKAGDSKD